MGVAVTEVQPSPQHTPSRKSAKRGVVRRSWSTTEKHAMRKHFKDYLRNKILPTPMECNEARKKSTTIKMRTVAQIKAWVNNQNVKSKF